VNILASLGRKSFIPFGPSGVEIELPLVGMIDLEAEKARVQKEIAKMDKEMAPLISKLKNENFLKNAPQEVVTLNRNRIAEFQEKLEKLNENLRRLGESPSK
jgi:valyl-tRNA synthetase